MKCLSSPGFKDLLPCIGTEILAELPVFPYIWWLPLMRRQVQPFFSKILANALPEIDLI